MSNENDLYGPSPVAKAIIENHLSSQNGTEKKQGDRFNVGKTRYDLLEPFAIEQLQRCLPKVQKNMHQITGLKG
jgi:hypothetical protein